ncbi:MAG TPA: DUF4920 domain-containing protein [Flavobacterium sp.]|uniref:DUF4920 domain-containing protein n=1 Tax=Flavobacterium sp. TaxID=239 RepID=UPI002BDD8D02|nr:DUF4920 domain-containing protein [Flavobacterium sp.]MCA0347816.1 DUF4920 domain-containing protein [Bacteroidota bacterium]HPW97943.1 DUF4920 domain-containing protein [Flavobacterium sp.]HQA74083.1 DUF4920 domain-containing protein [Flavobacterium sp.]
MKLFLVAFTLVVSAATFAQSKSKATISTANYALFGEKFQPNKILSKKEMLKKYKNLKKGDTISVQYASTIKSVCKKKGCWMKMDLTNDETSFVKFKDYEFFVPLNADGNEAIVYGKAFVDVVSVDELKHYAKDGGKSKDEINKITQPEVTYSFEASGVYIKK